jgi:SAM-dependent methyltransferase
MIILLGLILIVVVFFTVFFGAPYVPTKIRDVRIAFNDICKLTPKDVVLDLGSGDGKVLREVSRRGAKAVGYELHPILVGITKLLSRHDKNVQVKLGNFWHMTFPSNTTVVYLFGDSRDILRMTKKIESEALRLKRELRVLSYGFELPGHTIAKSAGAHNLYVFQPLHYKKA